MRPFETQNNFTVMKHKAGLLPSPLPKLRAKGKGKLKCRKMPRWEGS